MDVWECALGFMDSQVLLTAEELGVFDQLEEPRTAGEVAAAVGLPEDSAERLLTALSGLKLVRRRPDGRYVNGPEASQQLVRGKPGYVGALFEHVREGLYPTWNYFKEALQERRPQWERAFGGRGGPNEDMYADPSALRAFMEGMHTITYEAASELASGAPEMGQLGSVLDVGGASGAFVIAMAQRFPALRGTVLDLPPVRPIAEDFFRRHGLAERLSFHPADFFNEPIPSGAEAYGLGFILHDWDTEQGNQVLGKIARAAPPGGLLIVGEYLLHEDRSGPLHVARMDLNMLTAARGRERTAAEYARWLGDAGFALERIHPTSKGKHFLLARRGEAWH